MGANDESEKNKNKNFVKEYIIESMKLNEVIKNSNKKSFNIKFISDSSNNIHVRFRRLFWNM
jgi:hypothetical protein